jgi:drug/metabolite transporter (DMT)-like permease
MPENKCIITFSKPKKYLLLPLLSPIILIIGVFCLHINEITRSLEDKNKNFAILMNSSFVNVFAGMYYFIFILMSNENNSASSPQNRERNLPVKLIYNNIFEEDRLKKCLYLLLISILMFFYCASNLFIDQTKTIEYNLFTIIFISLFTRIILKIEIFRHQIISIILCIFGYVLISVPIIKEMDDNEHLLNNIGFAVSCLAYSLALVLTKYLSQIYYINPYKIYLYVGLFLLFATLLTSFIYYFINWRLSDMINAFILKENIYYLYWVLYTLLCAIYGIMYSYIIFYYSPTLSMITQAISCLLVWLINTVLTALYDKKRLKLDNILFMSIGYIILLFACLLYNEVIICNFCGLNKYVRKSIDERGREEYLTDNKSESEETEEEIIEEEEEKEG